MVSIALPFLVYKIPFLILILSISNMHTVADSVVTVVPGTGTVVDVVLPTPLKLFQRDKTKEDAAAPTPNFWFRV